MPNVVLSHAFEGSPDLTFYPALRKHLNAAGIATAVPQMPDIPDPGSWARAFEAAITAPAAETLLIGHSLGGMNILRFLGQRPADSQPFAGLVLVSTPLFDVGYEALRAFFEGALNWERIRHAAGDRIVGIYAANDPILAPDPLAHVRSLLDGGASKVVVFSRGGHFAPFDNCTDLPELRVEARSILGLAESSTFRSPST